MTALANKYGLKVLGSYADGVSLLKGIQQGLRPQVALVDIVMLGMTGIEVAAELAKLPFEVKVILVTSMAQNTVANLKATHAHYLLVKPFADEWLLRAILHVLKPRKADSANPVADG